MQVSSRQGSCYVFYMHRINSIFFIVYYLNLGSLIATILTPYLRSMECNDSDTCFPVAFGVPAALFIVAIGNYHKSII